MESIETEAGEEAPDDDDRQGAGDNEFYEASENPSVSDNVVDARRGKGAANFPRSSTISRASAPVRRSTHNEGNAPPAALQRQEQHLPRQAIAQSQQAPASIMLRHQPLQMVQLQTHLLKKTQTLALRCPSSPLWRASAPLRQLTRRLCNQ